MLKSKRGTRRVTATKVLKNDVIRLRVSVEHKQKLTDFAAQNGLDLSTWLRQLAFREARILPEGK